ncbi:MAG: TM2 domain-containing protein [Syntrophales bacterium]|nr:TM2 domain-containing protein [Syntrophales bacterium]
MDNHRASHSVLIGYVLWIFGFTGSHRFYFGKPISGTIYFCTLGLLGIGWLIDLFLIPSLHRQADIRFRLGRINYSVAWILLTFLGFFGIHRMYMGKWISGIIYLLTLGILGIGYIYDFWTLNDQITVINGSA